jgi:hypothetical protein
MGRVPSWLPVIAALALAVLGGIALAAQDRYTVRVPDGLGFADFRGFEGWQVVAVSQPHEPEEKLTVIVANPTMIDAYRAGIPGNGKQFPDGSKVSKILWNPKKSAEAPFSVDIPDTLAGVGFMMKDSKRFPDTGGWGYAQFDYNADSDTFTPNTSLQGNDATCGAACHGAVAAKDYIFTAYGMR